MIWQPCVYIISCHLNKWISIRLLYSHSKWHCIFQTCYTYIQSSYAKCILWNSWFEWQACKKYHEDWIMTYIFYRSLSVSVLNALITTPVHWWTPVVIIRYHIFPSATAISNRGTCIPHINIWRIGIRILWQAKEIPIHGSGNDIKVFKRINIQKISRDSCFLI